MILIHGTKIIRHLKFGHGVSFQVAALSSSSWRSWDLAGSGGFPLKPLGEMTGWFPWPRGIPKSWMVFEGKSWKIPLENG